MISVQQIRHWFARHTSMPLPLPLPLPRATRRGGGMGLLRWGIESCWTHSVVPFPAVKCSPMSRAAKRCICQGWDENTETFQTSGEWKLRERQWGACASEIIAGFVVSETVLGGCRPRRNRRLRIGDPLADLMLSAAASKFRGGWGKRGLIMKRFYVYVSEWLGLAWFDLTVDGKPSCWLAIAWLIGDFRPTVEARCNGGVIAISLMVVKWSVTSSALLQASATAQMAGSQALLLFQWVLKLQARQFVCCGIQFWSDLNQVIVSILLLRLHMNRFH
jgi:hypothetical protein